MLASCPERVKRSARMECPNWSLKKPSKVLMAGETKALRPARLEGRVGEDKCPA